VEKIFDVIYIYIYTSIKHNLPPIKNQKSKLESNRKETAGYTVSLSLSLSLSSFLPSLSVFVSLSSFLLLSLFVSNYYSVG
jgi:hypothetical protein